MPKLDGAGRLAAGLSPASLYASQRMSYALVSSHLADQEMAAAATAHDALKILKRREELQRAKAVGEALGPTLKQRHELFKGDCYQCSAPSAA